MSIEEKIKKKRKTLISLGMLKGFNHEEVLKCSQELDELLNLYHQEYQSSLTYSISSPIK